MSALASKIKRTVDELFEVNKDRSTTDELVFICPQPGCADKSGNRSVNLRTGRTNCWRCNVGHANFFKWVQRLGYEVEDGIVDPDISEVEKLIDETDSIGVRTITPLMSNAKLPRGFRLLKDNPRSTYYRLVAEMAERKNLHISDFIKAGAGYTMEDPYWEPYTIFPVMEWGKLVYYQGRMYGQPPPGEGTKKFPSRREVPLGSKYWVYNIDRVREVKPETIIIVEAIFNVLSLEKKIEKIGAKSVVPVAVFKHNMSKPQISKLLSLRGVKEFCLMFDADSTAESWKSAERLVNQRTATVASLPRTADNRTLDPNDDVDFAWDRFLVRRKSCPVESLSTQLDQFLEGNEK